jgi:hypothetical protein
VFPDSNIICFGFYIHLKNCMDYVNIYFKAVDTSNFSFVRRKSPVASSSLLKGVL